MVSLDNPRLYVSDLDHTILRKDKTLSEHTKYGINRLYDNNILFTIASARSVTTLQPILKDVNLHLPIIEFNGGYISDLKSGEHLVTNNIETDTAKSVWEIGMEIGEIPSISTTSHELGDRLYYTDIATSPGMQLYISNRRGFRDRRLTKMKNIEDVIQSKIMAFTFINTEEKIKMVKEEIIRQHPDLLSLHLYRNEYSPEWFWLTVHDITSTKEGAIQTLQRMYGLENHELVTFGDNVNDQGMIQLASRGFVVENGKEELKQIATAVIGNHENDSVINFILNENNL